MFRSGIELEMLAQAKVDDFYANLDRPPMPRGRSNPPVRTSLRRRFGLRLIAAGTRLVGPDLAASTRPAVAAR
jgi:hypothetical protein